MADVIAEAQALNDEWERTGVVDEAKLKDIQSRIPEGYVMAEDYTLVPTTYYDRPAQPQGQKQSQGQSLDEVLPRRAEIVKLKIPRLELELLQQISPEVSSILGKYLGDSR